jgi:hypothetical protein
MNEGVIYIYKIFSYDSIWESIMTVDFFNVGGYKWRVGVSMCQFRGLGKVCSWGWDVLVAKICSFGGFQCIGHIQTLRFV